MRFAKIRELIHKKKKVVNLQNIFSAMKTDIGPIVKQMWLLSIFDGLYLPSPIAM